MSRYIDAEALLKSIGRIPEGWIGDYDSGRWDVRQMIIEAPAADVVEVVRCKDCKHCHTYHKWNKKKYLGCFHNGEIYEVDPEHYCSYGERNEE